MRLDRLITLGLKPLCRSLAPGELPVLMYHSISDAPEPGVSPYYRTTTSPQAFERQMRCLAEHGWTGVTISEGMRAVRNGDTSRLVAITFDDAFADFEEEAMPVLSDYGFSATVYVPTSYVSQEGTTLFKGRHCMSWGALEKCQAREIEIGSHTQTHPKLVELELAQLEEELAGSKTMLERRLGKAVDSFAYPYAFPQANLAFCARLKGALMRAGYACCVTTEVGRVEAGTDPLRIPRLPVNGADDEALLMAKLSGAYDWMSMPQRMIKHLKAALPADHAAQAPSLST